MLQLIPRKSARYLAGAAKPAHNIERIAVIAFDVLLGRKPYPAMAMALSVTGQGVSFKRISEKRGI